MAAAAIALRGAAHAHAELLALLLALDGHDLHAHVRAHWLFVWQGQQRVIADALAALLAAHR